MKRQMLLWQVKIPSEVPCISIPDPEEESRSEHISSIKTDMSPTGDITIYKSQLFRTCGAPTAADRIRNPGYRPTYSYGLARPISMNSLMQAWLIHGYRPGLL